MEPVEIFRSHRRASCEERAFVLHAVGIESSLAWNGRTWSLLVDADTAPTAIEQLLGYEGENRPHRPPPSAEPHDRSAWLGSAAYVGILLVVGFLAGRRAFGHDWFDSGALHAASVRSGELWRAVTALTLHADLGHLLANLGFGAFFGLLAGQLLGPGVTWFCVLLAAVTANLLNSLIHEARYVSIGASTAVFAALGLLAAYSWRRHSESDSRLAYRWAPLVAGIALLGFMGVGGERTDVLAHLTGFVMGIVAGGLLSLIRRRPRPRVQFILALLATGSVIAAWSAALAMS